MVNKCIKRWLTALVIVRVHVCMCVYVCVCVCVCVRARALSHMTLCDPMDCSLSGSSVYGDSPGKNTGVGRHFLLQGIFPTPELVIRGQQIKTKMRPC